MEEEKDDKNPDVETLHTQEQQRNGKVTPERRVSSH